eukprot:m51a1_g4303 hypothetical protein (556) ;mRNA; r:18153-19943
MRGRGKERGGLALASPATARFCFLLAFVSIPAMWVFVLQHPASPGLAPPPVLQPPSPSTTSTTTPSAPQQQQQPAVAHDPHAEDGTRRPEDAAREPAKETTGAVEDLPLVDDPVAPNLTLEIPPHLLSKYSSAPGRRPFRVLFVSEVDVYIARLVPPPPPSRPRPPHSIDLMLAASSMSRWFFHLFAAMRSMPGVEAHLWGPGFAGYDDSRTVSANAARRWGRGYFDFYVNNTVHRNTARAWAGNGPDAPPVAVWHHECVLFERLPTRETARVFTCSHRDVDVVFHAYANHMAYYAESAAAAPHPRLLWHLPHAAHTPLFRLPSAPHSSRPIDVLIVGNIWSVYPLRVKFLKLYDERRLPGKVYRLVHPGYWLDAGPNGTSTPGTQAAQDSAALRAEEQTSAYVQALQSAKVVLVCSSKRRYAVRKYVEAAAAGALVIGDIPGEREEEFRSYVVEVKPTDTEDSIIRTVRWWLDHGSEREQRAAAGQKIALARYTTMHAAETAVGVMQSYVLGRRGLVFPHAYEIPDLFLPLTRPCSRSLQQLANAKNREKPKHG